MCDDVEEIQNNFLLETLSSPVAHLYHWRIPTFFTKVLIPDIQMNAAQAREDCVITPV